MRFEVSIDGRFGGGSGGSSLRRPNTLERFAGGFGGSGAGAMGPD